MEDKISEGVTSFKAKIIQSGKSIPGEYHNWPVYLAVVEKEKKLRKLTRSARERSLFPSHSPLIYAPPAVLFWLLFSYKNLVTTWGRFALRG